MLTTRARPAASTIRSASRTSRASGFSHRIALPARAAAIAISACKSFGAQISTMSIPGSAITTRLSVVEPSHPSFLGARLVPARSRPQIVVIRILAAKSKKRGACRQALECAFPLNPVPINPTENVERFGIAMLSEHTQACDFEDERFLRRGIQVVTQVLESPNPL